MEYNPDKFLNKHQVFPKQQIIQRFGVSKRIAKCSYALQALRIFTFEATYEKNSKPSEFSIYFHASGSTLRFARDGAAGEIGQNRLRRDAFKPSFS